MKTYKQFLEQVSGGSVGFRVPVGGTKNQLPGFKGVTGSVQGRSGNTNVSASGSLGKGTVSGQGDKINRGIDSAIKNYQSGSNANTSTSTIRSGTMGTFNAKVSAGSAAKPVTKPVEKPTPKPVAKPTPKPTPSAPVPLRPAATQTPTQTPTSSPTQTPTSSPTQQSTPSGSLPGETDADREDRWAAASRARDELSSMAAIDRARIAKGEKPVSNVLSLYPGAGAR